MTLKKVAICAAALLAATITSQLAQAGSKGTPNSGASSFAPGHLPPVKGDPGHSGNAPGDLKHDLGLKNAKELAPGDLKHDLAPGKKK